jgi:hypothetical protein
MRTTFALSLSVALFVAAAPAFAHHSFVMYDKSKETMLTGTVKEYDYVNPHVLIQMMVPGRGEWTIETESPLVLTKVGIDETAVRAGQTVTVRVHPLKNGGNAGSLIEIKKADGSIVSLRRDHTFGERMQG